MALTATVLSNIGSPQAPRRVKLVCDTSAGGTYNPGFVPTRIYVYNITDHIETRWYADGTVTGTAKNGTTETRIANGTASNVASNGISVATDKTVTFGTTSAPASKTLYVDFYQ